MSVNTNNVTIKSKLSSVEELLKIDALEPAQEILNELINLCPDNPDIYKHLGWISFKLEKLDDAEIYFLKTLNINENNAEYHYNLGWCYFYNNKLDLALEQYQKTIEIDPEYSLPYVNIGAIEYENGNYQKALEFYLKAKQLTPDYTHLLNNLGDTYHKLKEYQLAIKTYEDIIEIDPENARAYGNLAVTHNTIGNFSKAVELCKKALEINPQSINAHYNLACFYNEHGLYNEAFEEIIEAKNLAKHINKNIIELLITIKKNLDIDYEEDALLLETLLNDDPIIHHIIEGNHYKVIDITLSKLNENLNDFFYLSQLAYTLSQLGRYTQAIEVFEYAINLDDKDFWTLQHYAFALSQSNKKQKAVEFFTKAIEQNPYSLWPRKQLAETLLELELFIEAEKVINEALEIPLESENKALISELFSIKAKLLEGNNINEAIDWYLLAIKYNADESYNYERIAALIAPQYKDKISILNLPDSQINNLEPNNNFDLCNKAISYFRKGDIIKAIELYKEVLNIDAYYYPAYVGLSQALYEKRYGKINLSSDIKNSIDLSSLVLQWDSLTPLEQEIIALSIFPFKQYLNKIINAAGTITIVPLDTKITSLPDVSYLSDTKYIEGTSYQGIRALGGLNVYIGIERIRDLIWRVPDWLKQVPGSIAHEYAHQVYEILSDNQQQQIDTIYQNAITNEQPTVSEYSKMNSQEYFAENYAFYARSMLHKTKIPEGSEILEYIKLLST